MSFLIRSIKILAVNILVFALAAEIFFRLQEPYLHLLALGNYESPNNLIITQYHARWHHQLRAGLRDVELRVPFDGGLGYSISTNRMGLRYRELQPAKPPGTYRILVMGDSFTQGFEIENTVSNRLEERLNQGSETRYEVVNAGTSSYSPLLIYLRLRDDLLQLQPDAVIVNVDQTDLYDDWWRYRGRIRFDKQGEIAAVPAISWRSTEFVKMAMEKSVTVRIGVSLIHRIALVLRVIQPQSGQPRDVPLPTPENIYWFHTADPSNPQYQSAFVFLTENVQRILGLCAKHKIACAFTVYPHEEQVGPRATQHRAFSEQLKAFVEARATHFYDAYPMISEARARGEKLYFTGDMHFNQRGFEVWSEGYSRDLGEWVERSKKMIADHFSDLSNGPAGFSMRHQAAQSSPA